MDILGIIGYIVLIFLAITWIIGIRVRLNTSIPTVLSGFTFLILAISVTFFGIDYIYSWLFIIAGYVSNFIFLFVIMNKTPLLSQLLYFIGSLYAGIIRIGISSEKIKQQQIQDTVNSIEK